MKKKSIEKKWWALLGVGISSITVALDFTIVNTVLPVLEQQFTASSATLQWIMTGFGITFAALLISAGRLADLLGRRLMLYIGMLGFALASLSAGFSMTAGQLIVARVCQGMFGAMVWPCGMGIIAQAFNKEQRTRALSLYGGFIGVGMAAGPVLGGLVTILASWRWVFFINLPLLLISLLMCVFSVQESRREQKVSLDWPGMVLISLGLGTLVFGVTESQLYGWVSWPILLALGVAAAAFFCLIQVEKRAAQPLLPFVLFASRPFLIGVMVYVVCISFTWGILFFIPLYLQEILQLSVATSGCLLLSMTVMTVLAPPIAGHILHRQGPFAITVSALGASVFGLLLCLFFSENSSLLLIIISFVSIGLSWGIANGIALPLALYDPQNRQNESLVSGLASTVLNVVGVISLAAAGTLFHHVENQQLMLAMNTLDAFMAGFHAVILLLLILAIIGLLVVLGAFRGLKYN